MSGIDTAIVLAAGLGTRMRPITDRIPKPLVEVAGKTLLDHVLDPLAEAGARRVVVNVHHLADQIETAVAARTRPEIVISDEREKILDSGGGVRKALPHLGENFLIRNADSFWRDRSEDNLKALIAAFDPERMDALLLLATPDTSVGFEGAGDFFMDEEGRLTRRGAAARAPLTYAGAAAMRRRDFEDAGFGEVFSLNLLWTQAIARGRLFGLELDGLWLHVGTPEAIGLAEGALAKKR